MLVDSPSGCCCPCWRLVCFLPIPQPSDAARGGRIGWRQLSVPLLPFPAAAPVFFAVGARGGVDSAVAGSDSRSLSDVSIPRRRACSGFLILCDRSPGCGQRPCFGGWAGGGGRCPCRRPMGAGMVTKPGWPVRWQLQVGLLAQCPRLQQASAPGCRNGQHPSKQRRPAEGAAGNTA